MPLPFHGRLVRAPSRGKIFTLEHALPEISQTDLLRHPRKLEVDVRKLFGVLSLSRRAPTVAESFTLRFGGERSCAKDRSSAGS